eukprot:gb/GECG01016846.1/.p1 GENE.gb/GECG01016846.1/~~gb/GECG01016846.1/.p1  ORF type:complete len:212 (+),score=25.86 gb/GECG01016846.1/:1-636(+)
MSSANSDLGYEHLFKVLLIGDAGVGKSSILLRFSGDEFDAMQQPTIGVDFKVSMMNVDDKRVKATIWDTAGQERFRTLTSSYYRGAHGIVFVYDVTRPETLENLGHWLEEVKLYCRDGGKNVVKLLVGNKVDIGAERQVSSSEGQSWARSHGMLFIEASAKTKQGIQSVFDELMRKIIENPVLRSQTSTQKSGDTVNMSSTDSNANESGCC